MTGIERVCELLYIDVQSRSISSKPSTRDRMYFMQWMNEWMNVRMKERMNQQLSPPATVILCTEIIWLGPYKNLTGPCNYLTVRAGASLLFSSFVHVKVFRDKFVALTVFVITVFVHTSDPISLLLQPESFILIAWRWEEEYEKVLLWIDVSYLRVRWECGEA